MVKRIEKKYACWMPVDEIEDLFGVPMSSNLRIGDIRLGSDQSNITYHQNGTELVLETLDSSIQSMDLSQVTESICVGLESGHVGIFGLELEDVLDLVLVEDLSAQ